MMATSVYSYVSCFAYCCIENRAMMKRASCSRSHFVMHKDASGLPMGSDLIDRAFFLCVKGS